jgi:F-type H+-transporting ATPase subunit delta
MTSRAIATQYAKALFTVAQTDATPRAVFEELQAFGALTTTHADLRAALTSAAVPVQMKRAVLSEVLSLSRVSPLVREFLLILARHDHFGVYADLLAAYEQRLLQLEGVAAATVTTAVPLSAEREAALEQSLRAVTGKQVRLSAAVDPGILGGVVAQVGSTVYDGSVARQLQRLKEQMIQSA